MEHFDDEFDTSGLATDEISFHLRLGLKPVCWELGTSVYETLVAEARVLVSQPKKLLPTTFFGIPVKVMETGNPWTIRLISTDP